VALNFLGFLSGIATRANYYVQALGDSPTTEILDTRKTLPGFRVLSKYAVRTGGGKNHRQGLFDMILIKDNHIDLAGSLSEAVARVRQKWGDRFRIEAECRTLDEVHEAVRAKVDIIMLDNMEIPTIRSAISIVGGRAKVEVSGNVDMKQIKKLRSQGIDFISIGSLTHSVKSFDFSMKVDSNENGI
jgi:nicotinate-nucleotide pyrophosphorylase (carboxylating)